MEWGGETGEGGVGDRDKAVDGTVVDGTNRTETRKVEPRDGIGFARTRLSTVSRCQWEWTWLAVWGANGKFAMTLRGGGAGGARGPGAGSRAGLGLGSFAKGMRAWSSRKEG